MYEYDSNHLLLTFIQHEFVFLATYFFTHLLKIIIYAESGSDRIGPILRHSLRVPPSPYGYSVKTIMRPEVCLGAHSHYCWQEAESDGGYWVDAEASVGLNHHYKRCHFEHEVPTI